MLKAAKVLSELNLLPSLLYFLSAESNNKPPATVSAA